MAKRRDAGKTFLEEILAKVPEDRRLAVRDALFTDDIADWAGEQHLRHDEFSRMADTLQKQTKELTDYRGKLESWKGELTTWYQDKQREVETAKRAADANAFGIDERPDLTGFVKAEDYQREYAQIQEQGVALMSMMPYIVIRHYDQFKETLNPLEVIAHARSKGLTVDAAYEDYIKPRVEERQKKEHEAELAKAREEGAIAERRRQFTTPYPVGNQEPTTLDGLKSDFKKVNPVDAAVSDYYERQRSSTV